MHSTRHGPTSHPTGRWHRSICRSPLIARQGWCRSMLALGPIGAPAQRQCAEMLRYGACSPTRSDALGACCAPARVKPGVLGGCGRASLSSSSWEVGRCGQVVCMLVAIAESVAPRYTSRMEFEWDPEKAVGNLAKHGIGFIEASTIFGDPLELTLADPSHSGDEFRCSQPWILFRWPITCGLLY